MSNPSPLYGKIKGNSCFVHQVVYEETYYARDSGTLEQLKELSTKRQAIEESINGSSKITPAIAREMAGGVTSPVLQDLQKLERYLPLLENLVSCVEAKKDNPQIIKWTIDLSIRWTSPMSGFTGNRLTGPRYFRLDDLRFELAMVFFLYGGLLRELALEVLPTGMFFLLLGAFSS
jgi:hypothetical protein